MDHGKAVVHRIARVAREEWLPFEPDLAGIGGKHAHQNFHQRGLAGTILAHQGMDLATTDGQIHIVQHRVAIEAFGDTAHFKQGRRHGLSPSVVWP